MNKLILIPIIALLFGCTTAHLTNGDYVLVDRTNDAYTLYLGIPKSKIEEMKAKAPNGYEEKTPIVPWESFTLNSEKFIKAQIVNNEYPNSRTQDGIIELIRKFPLTPIGLAWNGGIVITYNDYQHAKRIYENYKTDPESYSKINRDIRTDPINPKKHLGPLLGW